MEEQIHVTLLDIEEWKRVKTIHGVYDYLGKRIPFTIVYSWPILDTINMRENDMTLINEKILNGISQAFGEPLHVWEDSIYYKEQLERLNKRNDGKKAYGDFIISFYPEINLDLATYLEDRAIKGYNLPLKVFLSSDIKKGEVFFPYAGVTFPYDETDKYMNLLALIS